VMHRELDLFMKERCFIQINYVRYKL